MAVQPDKDISVLASGAARAEVEIELSAAIVAMREGDPHILVVHMPAPAEAAQSDRAGARDSLPSGPFTPLIHRTLDIGLRAWVKQQTGLDLGYAEQLYTFGDRGRHARPGDTGPHMVSIGYLALTHIDAKSGPHQSPTQWRSWYEFFPWEDWRSGQPAILEKTIAPRLREWASDAEGSLAPARPLSRADRLRICFAITEAGVESSAWDEEKVLERYELLYEAGLVAEARADDRKAARRWPALPQLGRPMRYDHRRILATAMSRLRGKLKYRPVIFELMPEQFTLLALQTTVEAILGTYLHKQNFRRLVVTGGLVEPTGAVAAGTGGRPARLYRFRREVLLERPAPGLRVKPGGRGGA